MTQHRNARWNDRMREILGRNASRIEAVQIVNRLSEALCLDLKDEEEEYEAAGRAIEEAKEKYRQACEEYKKLTGGK